MEELRATSDDGEQRLVEQTPPNGTEAHRAHINPGLASAAPTDIESGEFDDDKSPGVASAYVTVCKLKLLHVKCPDGEAAQDPLSMPNSAVTETTQFEDIEFYDDENKEQGEQGGPHNRHNAMGLKDGWVSE